MSRRRSPAATPPPEPRAEPLATSTPITAGRLSTRSHQALVVEDTDDVREVVQDICTSLGHEAVCLVSQSEAEAALAERRFCYVLLDLQIPVRPRSMARIQTGMTTLERIRARFSHEELPVIVMTAHGRDHAICRQAFLLGATDFVKKPFDSEGEPSLEELIRAAVQRTCEARHPGGCPQLGAPPAARTEASPAAQPARIYTTSVRVHLDGRCRNRGYLVLVDATEAYVQYETFRVLLFLAAALRRGEEYVRGTTIEKDAYHKKISRSRQDLAKKANVDPKRLIESDGHGSYRLSTSPENVTFDEPALRTHHAELLQAVRW